MKLWRRMKARIAHLNARVATAEQLAATAEQEAAYSEERRRRVRETVIMPMHRAAAHNQFADKIRASLLAQAHREVGNGGH